MFSLCSAICRGTPVISAGFQANISEVVSEGFCEEGELVTPSFGPLLVPKVSPSIEVLLSLRSCCFHVGSAFFRAWLEATTSPPRNAVVTLIISSADFGILSCRRLISSWLGNSLHDIRDSHAFWSSLNMPTLSFKPLYKIFREFSFPLLDVVDFYRIFDALLLLKEVR
ncbi:hypothetical protein Tco_0666877 [Tanacetum coccineum]